MNPTKIWAVVGLVLIQWSIVAAKPPKKSTASSAEKPEAILAEAKKLCGDRAWRVEARITADKDMKISGIIAGKDFDLTTETLDGTRRQITLGEKSWASEDGGKTWKEADAKDRRFYYLVHTPITFSPDQPIPPHEKVAPQKDEDANVYHVRFRSPEKIHYEGDRPNWWIALENGKPIAIRRYNGPGVLEGASDYVTTDANYTPVSDQPPIVAPPGNPHAVAAEPGPESLLMAAMKKMSTGVWSVNGTVSSQKTIKVRGLLSGDDFDLTMEPGVKPNTPLRGIIIKDKAWVCSDGETWHAGSSNDRLLYNWTHTPIMSGRMEPPFEKIGTEQRDGQNWLHIKLKVPDKNADPKELPQYWLALDAKGDAQYIGHAEMPMFSRARDEVIHCSFDYAPSKEKIAPPSLGAPVDEKVHGFNDIEQHKFDWAKKIVRIELDPKILQSEQIGENTYRAFVKDTATPNHFGVVEFPFDSLVRLGFLKKTVSGTHAWEDLQKMGAMGRTQGAPVSFYVEIIPIGERPAARAVAVGAKLNREPDGTVTYSW